jgi:hypothetical protein
MICFKRKECVKTYVVRIYRSEDENPFTLVGVVEEVGVEGRKAFANYEELWRILKTPSFLSSILFAEEEENGEDL